MRCASIMYLCKGPIEKNAPLTTGGAFSGCRIGNQPNQLLQNLKLTPL